MAQKTTAIPAQQSAGFIQTGDADEVAVLKGLGVEMIGGAEAKKIYTARNPYESGRPQLEFTVSNHSSTWTHQGGGSPHGYPTGLLQSAYRSKGEPAEELDDLIEQIDNDDLRRRIKNTLPRAYAAYGRSFAEHRRDVMRVLHDALDWIKGRNRRGQSYMVARNASRNFRHKLKID